MASRRSVLAGIGSGPGAALVGAAVPLRAQDGSAVFDPLATGSEPWRLQEGQHLGERWVNDSGERGLYQVPHEQRTREVIVPDEVEAGQIHVIARYNLVLWTLGGGKAIRYAAALGVEGRQFSGEARVGRKEEWPAWTPSANMIRREPAYAKYAGGVEGGLGNPLGARALYLHRGGRDTRYRIHGTSQPWTIGQNVSSGCIRLYNHAILDLYERAGIGTKVIAY